MYVRYDNGKVNSQAMTYLFRFRFDRILFNAWATVDSSEFRAIRSLIHEVKKLEKATQFSFSKID